MGDWGFGRKTPPSSVQACESPCKLAKDGDDKLSDTAAARIEALTGKPVQKRAFRLQVSRQAWQLPMPPDAKNGRRPWGRSYAVTTAIAKRCRMLVQRWT